MTNIEARKIRELIESSQKILITSHISPDPDALSSLILLGTTLILNYKDKDILLTSEELTGSLNILKGYEYIKQQPLSDAIESFKPDLLIMVDAMNLERCSRTDSEKSRKLLDESDTKIVVIDHHEKVDVEHKVSSYFNQGSPATVQDVYELCFKQLRYKKPEGFAHTTLLGIISDTDRFMYDNPRHKATFELVNELIDAGASIELLENQLSRYSIDQLSALGELAKNVKSRDGFSFSYISDNFTSSWLAENKTYDDLKLGCDIFVSNYIRNIGDNYWGFIVYPELVSGKGKYSASFRSFSGAKNVSLIAKQLGGGGHKPAAGAKFSAENSEAAVKKVIQAIDQVL